LRIALVSPYDFGVPGGVNNHISHLATEFVRLGHEASILVPSSDRSSADARVINASSVIIPVPFAGSIAHVSLDPRVYRRTKRILQEGGYDVLHLHEPLMPLLPLAVLRHHDLVPQAICVGTFHAYRQVSRAYYYGAPIFRRFFKRLDGHITVSEAARQYHLRYFPTDTPSSRTAWTWSSSAVGGAADRRVRMGGSTFFVGRLEKRKGLPYLIEAFARQREVPEAGSLSWAPMMNG
jgi:phosphatidylinositol alpha-mannosyltransferase